MDVQAIESLLESGLPGCQYEVVADGNKVEIRIVSAEFEGLNRVKRQQKIYGLLDGMIKSGEIHAVSMVTRTPAETGE